MENNKEVFVDGVSQVHFLNGVIRMDLFRLQPEEGKNPSQEVFSRLLCTPEGFLGIFGAMQQMADKLAEAGIFQKRN